MTPVEDARPTEKGERVVGALYVELIASGVVERALPVRPHLRADSRFAQQAEAPPSRRSAREVKMQCPLASSAEMEAAGGVEERRELGATVALPLERDPRELLPDILGGHRTTPSSASSRCLTPMPAEP